MLVCVGAALLVLAIVAIPRVRNGERLLTRDGEEAVRDARRRATVLAADTRTRARAEAARRRPDRADVGRVPSGGSAGVGAVGAAAVRAPARPAPAAEEFVPLEETPNGSANGGPDAGTGGPGEDGRPALSRLGPDVTLARRLEWGEPEPGPRHRR